MSRRLLWLSVLIGSALSVAGVGCLVTQRLAIGSAAGGSFYPYFPSFNSCSVEPFLIACPLVAAAVAESWRWLQRLSNHNRAGAVRLQEWALILTWCLLAVAIQGLLRSMTPFPLDVMFRERPLELVLQRRVEVQRRVHPR